MHGKVGLGPLQAVLACDCILRNLEFKQSGQLEEISALLRKRKVTGFLSFGELHRGIHVNQTLTGVAASGAPTSTGAAGGGTSSGESVTIRYSPRAASAPDSDTGSAGATPAWVTLPEGAAGTGVAGTGRPAAAAAMRSRSKITLAPYPPSLGSKAAPT